jgi:hypothetical protein
MALVSDSAMVLYYDITGDNADHDDWHTYEHMHERLSIPGFLRGTRWIAKSGKPRYLILYEVGGVEVSTSSAYLARLNDPTAWTIAMMNRFRGMIRGFCTVVASSGYGLGRAALSVRFSPAQGRESELLGWLAQEVIARVSSRRGLSSASLLQPAPKPPMTKEQSIRGRDTDMTWVLLATGYDSDALESLSNDELDVHAFERHGSSSGAEKGIYGLDFTLTAQEAARSAPNPPLQPDARQQTGARR